MLKLWLGGCFLLAHKSAYQTFIHSVHVVCLLIFCPCFLGLSSHERGRGHYKAPPQRTEHASVTQGTDNRSSVIEDALKAEPVLCYWEAIADGIPPAFDAYSVELLKALISLWVGIRAHVCAKGWTMKFQNYNKKPNTYSSTHTGSCND